MTPKPYTHQAKEYQANRYAKRRALFWQQRTGKTRAIIESACALHEAGEIGGVLVIAPNMVHVQWANEEVPKWSTGIPTIFPWRMSQKDNQQRFAWWLTRHKSAPYPILQWLCVNMESLMYDQTRAAIAAFKKQVGWAMLVVDEAHHFGKAGAKRTAIARGLGRQFEYARILTGTPMEESPLRVFTQFEILEKGALGHATYGSFKQEFAEEVEIGARGRRFKKISGYKNLDVLRGRMAKYTSVVLRKDCEDLPALQFVTRLVELTKEQQSWWRKVKEKEIEFLIKEYDGNSLTGGAALVKLQQIEGGWFKDRLGSLQELVTPADNPKMLILQDELSQYDGQVVVWFKYVHELEAAHELLGGLKYHGQMHDAEREINLAKFKKGRAHVLLATPDSLSEGHKLPAGKMIWYSQTPSARQRSQANERATLMGGEGVQIVDLKTPGGVDDYWLKITADKTARADEYSRDGLRDLLRSLEI